MTLGIMPFNPVIRPFVTLKLATSLDGRIAMASGESRWITGPEARRCVHELRCTHDAVLVGIETVLADDPELTVRLPHYEGPQPMRIVLDSKARLPKISKLAQTARILPTFLVTTLAMPSYLAACGIKSIVVAQRHQKVDLALAMEALVNIGVERLFVEGGAQIATAFLKAGYVDRVEWFRAPTVMGGDSKPAIGYLNLADLSQALRFMRLSVQSVGDDLWETYEIMGDD